MPVKRAGGRSKPARAKITPTQTGKAPDRRWVIALVPLLALVAYLNSLSGDFVWDDIPLIAQNPSVTLRVNLSELFTSDFFSYSDTDLPYGYYRPVIALSYLVDHLIWENDPFGFHLTNILLHVFNSLMVSLLFLRLGLKLAPAWVGGAIFAVHPLHVESVAWIAGRTDLVSFFFVGLAFLGHLNSLNASYTNRKKLWFRAGSVVLFCAGLLAKEMAVVYIVWLILVYLLVFQNTWLQALRASIPHMLVFAVYLWVRFWLIDLPVPNQGIQPPLYTVLLTALPTVMRYLGWLILPITQNPYVQNPYVTSALDWRLWLAVPFLLIIAGVIRKRKNIPPNWLLALCMLAISFGPLINLVRPAGPADMGAIMAARLSYFPSFPFAALAGLGLMWAVQRFGTNRLRRTALVALVVFWVAALTTKTVIDNRTWRNEPSLFNTAILRAPDSALMYACLANHHLRNGALAAADEVLKKAERLSDENHVITWRVLWYVMQGRAQEAIPFQTQMLANAQPRTRPVIQNNLAYLYRVTGQLKEARKILLGLVSAGQAHADVHYNLAEIHLAEHNTPAARQSFNRALKEKPFDLKIGTAAARMELSQGEYDAAEAIFNKLLGYYPRNAGLYNNLGIVLREKADLAKAADMFKLALSIDPNFSKAKANLDNLRK